MSTQLEKVSYQNLIWFFLPLAATPIMIGLTHSIINAALARLPYPEESIAVFTVIKGIVMIVSSPSLMSLQLIVTYIDDRESLKMVLRFVWAVGATLFAILLLLAHTYLGRWVLTNLIGLNGEKEIAFAYTALKIAAFLPLVQIFRNSNQGLAVSLKQTRFFIPGIVLRLVIISTFLWFAVNTQLITGVAAASLTWVAGIGIEGLFIFISLLYSYRGFKQIVNDLPTKNARDPEVEEIIKFFIPLGLTLSIGAFLQPVIQSGIARGELATESLAAYGVAWSLIAIITGPLRMLHQVSLVFVTREGDQNWRSVFSFSLLTGLFLCLLIIITAVSPLGYFLLHSIIGVSDQITAIALRVVLAFSFFPIIWAFRETYWGLLMRRRTTSLIGIAKLANISTAALALFLCSRTSLLQPAVLGALALTTGEAVESFIIWFKVRERQTQSR